MSKFEIIRPALDLLVKNTNDASHALPLFGRYLEEGIAIDFIDYLDKAHLVDWNVWFGIYHSYYTRNNHLESKYSKVTAFLYDYSLVFFEKFSQNADKATLEKCLDHLFPVHTFMPRELTDAWLKDHEEEFLLHLFSHLKFTHYPALRKALSHMANVNEKNNIIFNDNGLHLLKKIANREGIGQFIYQVDLEAILNSNFAPWILGQIHEQNYMKELWVQASLGKTQSGLHKFLNSYYHPSLGHGLSVAYYLMSNAFISTDLFKTVVQPILNDNYSKKIMLDCLTQENILTNALGYNFDKVTYLIDELHLDIKKQVLPKYEDLIEADIFYLDELAKLKERYKDSKMFNFSFMMNELMGNKSFIHKDNIEVRLEKILMLTNAKQLDKKTIFSNAVKYLTHQKSQFDQQHLEHLKSVIEKIYFSLDEFNSNIESNVEVAHTKRKMKI